MLRVPLRGLLATGRSVRPQHQQQQTDLERGHHSRGHPKCPVKGVKAVKHGLLVLLRATTQHHSLIITAILDRSWIQPLAGGGAERHQLC
jgi:hypothetical protein